MYYWCLASVGSFLFTTTNKIFIEVNLTTSKKCLRNQTNKKCLRNQI